MIQPYKIKTIPGATVGTIFPRDSVNKALREWANMNIYALAKFNRGRIEIDGEEIKSFGHVRFWCKPWDNDTALSSLWYGFRYTLDGKELTHFEAFDLFNSDKTIPWDRLEIVRGE